MFEGRWSLSRRFGRVRNHKMRTAATIKNRNIPTPYWQMGVAVFRTEIQRCRAQTGVAKLAPLRILTPALRDEDHLLLANSNANDIPGKWGQPPHPMTIRNTRIPSGSRNDLVRLFCGVSHLRADAINDKVLDYLT